MAEDEGQRVMLPGGMRTVLRAYFLFDARTDLVHAFRYVEAGLWVAVCPEFEAVEPETLRDHTEDDPRCQDCLIVLGNELADQQGRGYTAMRPTSDDGQ